MSFAPIESSLIEAAPRQLFQFTMGNTKWTYGSGITAPKTYLSDVYQPLAIEMQGYTQSLAEASPTTSIKLLATASVCDQFTVYQPISPMYVKVYRYQAGDPQNEYVLDFIGEVVSSARDEETNMVTLACRLVSSKMDRTIPWPVYQKQCNRALYQVGCNVNREDYRTDATLSAANGVELKSPAFSAHEDGWFRGGDIVNAANERRFIIFHEGDTIIVQTPFVTQSPGDVMAAYAGCDLSRQMCRNKFNNLHRYSGFAWVPAENPFADNVFGANPNADAE